jgi:hypothetical protein
VSVTFVSLDTGWALGAVPCGHSRKCLDLRQTADAGRTWSDRPLPAALLAEADPGLSISNILGEQGCCGTQLGVRFADPHDGWIYGSVTVPSRSSTSSSFVPTLWSTHDGGMTWSQQHLFAGVDDFPVYDVEAGAGRVYALVPANSGAAIESSPVANDHWAKSPFALNGPAGGSQPYGAIVLQGATGWVVYGNDRGVDGSARLNSRGQWVSWAPPCDAVGNSFAVPAASTPEDLVAVCVMGGFASALSKSAPRGATLESAWLYTSDNGGQTFSAGPELGREGNNYGDLLASPAPGVVLVTRFVNSSEELEASFDGGHHWALVNHANLFYLGFTSPSQGVALAATSGATTAMEMTFDGGRQWSPVTF